MRGLREDLKTVTQWIPTTTDKAREKLRDKTLDITFGYLDEIKTSKG